ncbi:MAG: TIGR02302 family protein [Azospirillaceae bacterium]|nr:TIGR02302 family protein [Azospirillaceae bacterium]
MTTTDTDDRTAMPVTVSRLTALDRGTGRAPLWRAQAIIAFEMLWPALAPTIAIGAGFLALALFNLLPDLNGWVHLAVLIGFAAAGTVMLERGLRRFRWPDRDAARRRVERDSGLHHRPLTTLRDGPGGPSDRPADPLTAALWQIHQRRIRAQLGRFHLSPPATDMPSRDPWALRLVPLLLLVLAAAGTRGDWMPRLTAAVSPHLTGGAPALAITLDSWITPPDYTGLPPVFLKVGQTDRIPVAQGSTITARLSGSARKPDLNVNDATVPFTPVEANNWQITQTVQAGNQIAVTAGRRIVGAWPITVIADQPPTIAFAMPPQATERAVLRLDYQAGDDYGLTTVAARIKLDPQAPADATLPPEIANVPPIAFNLSLPGLHPKQARGTAYQDLTSEAWAGLPVIIQLIATDGAGQTGVSDALPMVLPERAFVNPTARAIIAARRTLILQGNSRRSEVIDRLTDIAAEPDRYDNDIVVFLALRSAANRLDLDSSDAALGEVRQLLWETALRLEDGGTTLALRDLRQAEQQLMDALNRDASPDEIRALMNALQAAMDKAVEAMQQQMAQQGSQPDLPEDPNAQAIDSTDLQHMLDQMRQLAETGSRDSARQMLSQLQQMMENLRTGGTSPMSGQASQAAQLLRDLQALGQQQQKLLDRTFRDAEKLLNSDADADTGGPRVAIPGRQGRPNPRAATPEPNPGPESGTAGAMSGDDDPVSAAEQQTLRRQLGDIMRRMGELGGEIPRPFGRADRAMRDAEQALDGAAPDEAVPPETQAIDALQQGLQAFAQQMQQQMQAQGAAMGRFPWPPNRNRDPLGRPADDLGANDRDSVRLPADTDLQRARQILDELRRRDSEFSRPQLEHNYIERLLRRF